MDCLVHASEADMFDPNSNGHLITKLRNKSGLTQDEIAEKLGKSRVMVNRYETGKNQLPLDDKKLTNLLNRYKIPFEKRESSRKDPKTFTKRELSDMALSKLCKKLDLPESRKKASDFIKSLIVEEINQLTKVAEDFGEMD